MPHFSCLQSSSPAPNFADFAKALDFACLPLEWNDIIKEISLSRCKSVTIKTTQK